MRIFMVIGILFYAAVVTLIGTALVVFSLNRLQPSDISNFFIYLQNIPNSKVMGILSGALLIIVSYFFAKLILVGKLQRERTIAFTTAQGEVIIALSAVEDLIRRLTGVLPEIKELRPDVIATKKGLMVDIRVILKSEASIPELTTRLQELTKTKIQEVLGIEEQINIRIHVTKIIAFEEKGKKGQDREGPAIPYSGFSRT